jgi:hypothetical protein
MSNPAPIVFISYSHDSEQHLQRVLELSTRLRHDGYDTRLDRYVNGTPAEGWPNWMMNQLDEAAFTLVVCTETYYKRFRGKEAPDRGHGVAFEGVLITNTLYESKCQSVKFVPILFDSMHTQFIPEPLLGVTHYLLDSKDAYQELRKFLDGAAGVEPGPIGEHQPHVRSTATPLTFPVLPELKPNQSKPIYSCFISYSSQDEEFCKRLHSCLEQDHVRVWFAPKDMKGGEKIHEQIDAAIGLHDKLLLVVSEHSMKSEWVCTEIRKARKREVKEGKRVLFPIRLVPFERLQEWEAFDADTGKDMAVEVREYYVPDFTTWKDRDRFEAEYKKLLHDLQASAEKPK